MMPNVKNENVNIRTLPIDGNQLRAVKNSDGTTTISGYAVVFDQPSQPLPFTEYIDSRALDGVDLSGVLLLYGHDYNKVLARADAGSLTTKLDDHGLKFTAELPNTTLANDTRENITAGNIRGCSFGFTLPADGSGEEWQTSDDGSTVHYVKRIETVSELTITPIPAYVQTSLTVQRDYSKYLRSKEATNEMENDNKQTQTVDNNADSKQDSEKSSLDEMIKRAVDEAVKSTLNSLNKAKRDDEDVSDDVDVDDGDDEIEDDKQNNQSSPQSTAAASQTQSDAASSAVQSSASDEQSSASSTVSENVESRSVNDKHKKEEKRDMLNVTPKTEEKNLTRDLHDYLTTREMSRDLREATAGVGLAQGAVLIPHTILAADHEEHQFPRLGQFVNQIAVSTTTGTKPYFDTTNAVLQTKAEFENSKEQLSREIKSTDWKLQSYAGKFTTSRDLLMDAQYDWVSELRQTLNELRDNTDDALIAQALTTNPGHNVTATDAVADLKTALNVNLKPVDSQNAQIILTQSAYDALDQLKDGFGRPLLQPDPTAATNGHLFGKSVVVVADELLGKAGDAVAIVSPLKKAVTKFFNGQISGQFLDNFDVFDVVLGLFVREDVKAIRPDLVTVIKMPAKAIAASDASGAGKGGK